MKWVFQLLLRQGGYLNALNVAKIEDISRLVLVSYFQIKIFSKIERLIVNCSALQKIHRWYLRYNHHFGDSMRVWYGTNIHNSVIYLNWDIFDSKIMIYMAFRVSKDAEIWGGQSPPPYFANLSPKIWPYSLVLPKKACRNALISPQKCWCPNNFAKKRPKLGKNSVFLVF